MPSYEPESNYNIITKTKNALKNNSFAKFLVLGGAASALVNSVFSNGITNLIESLGIGTGGYIISQSLKGDKNMNHMTNSELNIHMTKSAFLLLGGSALGGIASLLPGPLAHIAQYPTSSLMTAGIIGVAESGYQKIFKKRSF
jgi:hypothetical protein